MSVMATEARTMRRWGHVAALHQTMRGQRHNVPGFGDVLWRRKLVILACIGLVLGLTAAYVSTLARSYEATALLALGDAPARQVGQDTPMQVASLEDQLRLIESRAMAERLVDRLDLHFLPEFRPNIAARGFRFGDLLPKAILDRLPSAWADALVSRPPDPAMTDEQRAARLWEEVIGATMARIRAEATSPSTIGLKFTSRDRQLAAAGANALAELYLEEHGALRQNASGVDSARLEQEIERLRASIRETEQAIEAARPGAEAQARATGEQSVLDLTGELAFWRRERAELEARLHQTLAMLESGADLDRAALALDSERLGQLQASAIELRQTLADLSQQYGEEDPSILELRAQLAALEQERRAEVEYIVRGLQEELAIIQSRETALENQIAALEEQSVEDQAANGLAVLEQRLQAERAELREYLEQAAAQLGSQPSASAPPDAGVITRAVVPDQPTYPRLALIWGVGSAGALLLGVLAAFALEALQRGRA
jgi:succinoglycan biosynthesis transport protein ExoP